MDAENVARAKTLAHKIVAMFAGEKLEVLQPACDYAKFLAVEDAILPRAEQTSMGTCSGIIGVDSASDLRERRGR